MRIAFDAVSLTKERSAVANYLTRLLRRLVEVDADLQVLLLAPDKICVEYDVFIHHPRIRRVVLDLSREERRQWHRLHLPRLLRQHEVDLFHQPGGLDTAVFHPPCPVVITVHDMAPWVLNLFKTWRKSLMYKYRAIVWSHKARRLLTGTQASRGDIIRLCRVPQERVALTPYGAERIFEAEIPAGEADDVLRKYRLLGKRYVINPSGLNIKRRNLDLVLDGFARLQREVPEDVLLVFTGPIANSQGSYDRAQRKMGMLGIRDKVVTTGFVTERSLQVILENAEAVLITSFHEGFPQTMAEAFASGVPVIATDRGGVPEVAGEAAIIIDPYDEKAMADALKRFLGNEVERHAYADKGQARAQEHPWARTARETLDVYRALCR